MLDHIHILFLILEKSFHSWLHLLWHQSCSDFQCLVCSVKQHCMEKGSNAQSVAGTVMSRGKGTWKAKKFPDWREPIYNWKDRWLKWDTVSCLSSGDPFSLRFFWVAQCCSARVCACLFRIHSGCCLCESGLIRSPWWLLHYPTALSLGWHYRKKRVLYYTFSLDKAA